MSASLNTESVQLITAYIKRRINLEKEINALKNDIKELKYEFSEQGLSVKVVDKAFTAFKRKKKTNSAERDEIDFIVELLEQNKEIDLDVTELITKK